MRIAIATVQVPFVTGGAELHAQMLQNELRKRGNQAEIVTIPFKWYPPKTLTKCMLMGRTMDLTEVNGEKIDLVIAMKFPAYYVKHPNKVLWILHQHRQAYDLWETPYGDLHQMPRGRELREFIKACDTRYISEGKRIFTNSQNTSKRLMKYNGISSEPLYHPPLNWEKMRCEGYGDYIFYASRVDEMKRQRLLVEAARYVKTNVKFVIAGSGSQREMDYLWGRIAKYHLESKVSLLGFISEEEKLSNYANCLAVYFGAYDEDYGYITLEGFFSKKAVIVHQDAGGPLEFVQDQENGYILQDDARAIAEAADELFLDREKARRFGECGAQRLKEMNMNWDYVIERLIT